MQYCEWPSKHSEGLENSDEVCTQRVVPYQIHAIKFANYTDEVIAISDELHIMRLTTMSNDGQVETQ